MCLVFVVAVVVAFVVVFFYLPTSFYRLLSTCSLCTPFGRISVYNPGIDACLCDLNSDIFYQYYCLINNKKITSNSYIHNNLMIIQNLELKIYFHMIYY